jgi:GxxExxY protein
MNSAEINLRSGEVVDAAMQVHSTLGPGLLEGAYEACLAHELRLRGFHVATQLPLPITYKGVKIELGYRADLLVDNAVLVELKAVRKLVPLHEAQLLSYLKLSSHRVGLLINFHVVHLKDGIKRLVHRI